VTGVLCAFLQFLCIISYIMLVIKTNARLIYWCCDRIGKFMTQCKKPWINPGFMTSCHKQVYNGLWQECHKLPKTYIF